MANDHFGPEDWVDFARGVISGDPEREMRRHLDEGCRYCTELHDTWKQVADMAGGDARYEPPESAVHLVRAVYSAQKPAGRLARAIETARVLFDSQLLPMPAGVRTGGASPRRKVLCTAGDLLVDLQVEPSSRSGRTVLVGQVTSQNDPPGQSHSVLIVVMRQMAVVAKATTNRLGEFQVEFDGPPQELSIALGTKERGAVVALGNLTRM